jgi:hypothetical protein
MGMRRGTIGRKSARSMSHLRMIGLACHMWADDNDEVFPPKLDVLMPEYIDDKKVLLCPGYGKHAKNGIDYAYVAGLKAVDPGSTVMAYETLPDARGRVRAMFTDAHVETLTLAQLKKRLAAQEARLKKLKRKMTIIAPVGVARGPGGAEELGPETFFALIQQLTNPATMPSPEVVSKHLFPSVSSVRKVPGGVLRETFSPLGFGGGFGGLSSPQGIVPVAIVAAVAIPNLISSRRVSLEVNAVGSCRAYASAQTMFHRNDWDADGTLEYAEDFVMLNKTKDGNGDPIQLIDTSFANAKGPKGTPKHGYVFYNMKTIAGEKIDWVNDYALCAVPAVYGRTGFRTFIINTNGTVFGQDNGGKPVFDYPADPTAKGWIIAE